MIPDLQLECNLLPPLSQKYVWHAALGGHVSVLLQGVRDVGMHLPYQGGNERGGGRGGGLTHACSLRVPTVGC